MLKRKTTSDDYLTVDPPLKALFVFTVPIVLGSLFQQIYNMADAMIVGQFVGQNALAAIGASSALTTVFICIAVGAGTGASVIVSRRFGAGNFSNMKQAVWTSMIFFVVLSIVLGAAGFFFSESIMRLLSTPAEVMDMAVLYLKVYFAGFPFLFLYNVISNMYNAVGKSRIPLYFLIFSSALNIVLDLYTVVTLNMGVFGAALSTLIAQGISALLSFVVFQKILREWSGRGKVFSLSDLREILSYALPSIIQQSTVSIGMMLVQSVVNGFGAEALAGFSATARVENLISVIFISIGTAVTPFTAQNLGAEKPERIPRGFHAALIFDAVFAAIVFAIVTPFARPIAGLFLGSSGTDEAYRVACAYMHWLGYFSFFLGLKMAGDGLLKGLGRMKRFMTANIVNLTIRVLTAMLLAPRFGIGFVWYAVPVGWIVNFLISRPGWKNYSDFSRKQSDATAG